MKKIFLTVVTLASLLGLMVSPMTVMAADTGTIECSVSGKLVSVTITTDGTVNYGALSTGTTKNTILYDASTNPNGMTPADSQAALNDGTVAEDFKITSSVADGVTDWILSEDTGENTFTHKASIDNGQSWIAMPLPGTYVTFATNVAPNTSQTFNLQLGMPTSTTDYGTHTITITILATEHL